MHNLELINAYKASKTNPIKQGKLFEELLELYFKLITDLLIKRGVSPVHIKDSMEYSIALVALYEALDKYNPEQGNEFSTFLTHHTRIHMTRHFAGYICGVHRFANPYDTTESMDRSIYNSGEPDCADGTIPDAQFFEDTYADNPFESDPLSYDSVELLNVPEHNSEIPAYERFDSEEELDRSLLTKFSETVAFGIKLMSGLSGYGKLGKIHVFRLIGTEHREELATVLARYNLAN